MADKGRPRRSAVQPDYSQLAAVVEPSESDNSDTESVRAKRRRNAALPPMPDDDSEEGNYEPEEDTRPGRSSPNKSKSGKAARNGAPSDTDSDQNAASSSDEQGTPEEDDESGVVGSDSDDSDDRPKKVRVLVKLYTTTSTAASMPRRRHPLASSDILVAPQPPVRATKKGPSTRARGFNLNNLRESTYRYDPWFTPPARYLHYPIDKSTSAADAEIRTGPWSKPRQEAFLKVWRQVAHRPDAASARDLGWWKGKWTKTGMADRWGGWYDEAVSANLEKIHSSWTSQNKAPLADGRPTRLYSDNVDEELGHYLPKVVYPSQPAALHFDCANPIAMAGDDDEPQVKLRIGLTNEDEDGEEQEQEQELITLPVFTSRRLGMSPRLIAERA